VPPHARAAEPWAGSTGRGGGMAGREGGEGGRAGPLALYLFLNVFTLLSVRGVCVGARGGDREVRPSPTREVDQVGRVDGAVLTAGVPAGSPARPKGPGEPTRVRFPVGEGSLMKSSGRRRLPPLSFGIDVDEYVCAACGDVCSGWVRGGPVGAVVGTGVGAWCVSVGGRRAGAGGWGSCASGGG
jgi:hypothetical protein